MLYSKHWLTAIALEGLSQVEESLQYLSHLPSIQISEVHVEQGKFSLLLLSRSLNFIRQSYSGPIKIFRLDFPRLNYPEMIQITNQEPESYISLPDCFTYYMSGSYWSKLHPPNTISLHIYSHILCGVLIREKAPDHFYPSLSLDQNITSARKKHASEDLKKFLQCRYEELIPKGRIYMDVLGVFPDNNNYHEFLNKCFFKAIDVRIVDDSFRDFAFIQYYWTKAQLDEVLLDFEGQLGIVSYKDVIINMPQYSEYLEDHDLEKFAKNFIMFMEKALDFALRFNFKQKYTDSEYVDMNKKLCDLIYEELIKEPPTARIYSHHLVLEKINND